MNPFELSMERNFYCEVRCQRETESLAFGSRCIARVPEDHLPTFTMNINQINNERGLTLVELIVTIGVSSVLVVILVSGTLFVQKYLDQWSRHGSLIEEIVLVQENLTENLRPARRIDVWADSLTAQATNGKITTYAWADSLLTKNGRSILRSGVRVHRLSITDFTLTEVANTTILPEIAGAGNSAYLCIHIELGV